MRARVLDAAEQALLTGGFGSGRLHSATARLVGLSRPTVYKYVGDQDAIIAAVIQRELATFLEELRPLLEQARPLPERLENVLVFVVERARAHTLLQAALRQIPDRLLPWFTTHADVLLRQVEPMVAPHVRCYVEDGQLGDMDPRVFIDALCRVALSLVFTRGLIDLERPGALRGYLAMLLGAASVTR
jgi:AcrR family transcriptional regulator